jgi:hypothetical protein
MIFNMDEKGVQLGVGGRYMAIIDRDQALVYSVEQGNRDLLTVIECVSAKGVAIRPLVIFPGKNIRTSWGIVNPCNASYALFYSCC